MPGAGEHGGAKCAPEYESDLQGAERASRTVFVTGVNPRAGERDLFTLFSQAGKVLDIKLITDKVARRSKVCRACFNPLDAACLDLAPLRS